MAITATPFRLLMSSLANKEADLNSDTLKVSCHTSAFTPNVETMQYWDVSVNNELSASGYTAGGATITGPTFSYDSGSGLWKLDGADITVWTTVTDACRYSVVYDSTPASNKPLIGLIDWGEDVILRGIEWAAAGILTGSFT